jgi:hypothetical protein
LYLPLPTRSRNSIVGGGSRSRAVNSGVHFRRAVGASSAAAAEHTKMVDMRTCIKIREESKQKRFSKKILKLIAMTDQKHGGECS